MRRLITLTLCSTVLLLTACTPPTTVTGTTEGKSAHDLYLEQLNKQDEKLNTGIMYWLELDRGGQKSHVTNKTEFHNGDRLRIHVKPNIPCYSYILLYQGSNGDRSVLFPSDTLPDNKLAAGNDVVLPFTKKDEAWMKFDEHPGTELVRIVVSRTKIDASQELPKREESSPVSIAPAHSEDDKVPDPNTATVIETEGTSVKTQRNLTVETTSAHPDEEGQITVVSKDNDSPLKVDIAMSHIGSN